MQKSEDSYQNYGVRDNSIKEAGVACVIAKTFARIFFRNAINIALPLLA